jgi:ABC-type antimicrobial peptide transport system permease subunit
MVQERDNDLINLIQMYITRVGEIQTALINEEACYQQARNVCAAASVMSTAVCYLSNEEIKESWLVKVVSLLDTWLTTNVKYQVTYVKTQKVKSNDMFGNTYVEKIPVEKTKMVNYKMQDNMSTLLKRARTRCIDVYDQLPSRVEREKNLLQKLEESRKLEEELKKKVDGLRLKFSNDKEEFYKNDNVSKSKKNRKNLLAIIFSFIGIMIGIILAVNQSMIFGIVIALVIIIISFVVRQKSIENMEKEIFTEELQQSQAELTEIEKNHQKAVLDKNEAEQAVKQFNLTKFK